MPKDSIRDKIFNDFKEILKVIKGGDDYFYTISDDNINIIHGNANKDPYKDPYIYLYPGIENYNLELAERGKFYKTLSIDIEAWIRSDDSIENINRNINRMIHDLEKSIATHNCMPNDNNKSKIIDIIFLTSTPFMEALDSPKGGVILSTTVIYQQDYEDPSKETVFT